MRLISCILILCVLLVGSGRILHVHTCGETGERSLSFFEKSNCQSIHVSKGKKDKTCEKSCCAHHQEIPANNQKENPCDDSSLESLIDLKKDTEVEHLKIPEFTAVYSIQIDSFTRVEISISTKEFFLNKAPPLKNNTPENLQRWII